MRGPKAGRGSDERSGTAFRQTVGGPPHSGAAHSLGSRTVAPSLQPHKPQIARSAPARAAMRCQWELLTSDLAATIHGVAGPGRSKLSVAVAVAAAAVWSGVSEAAGPNGSASSGAQQAVADARWASGAAVRIRSQSLRRRAMSSSADGTSGGVGRLGIRNLKENLYGPRVYYVRET